MLNVRLPMGVHTLKFGFHISQSLLQIDWLSCLGLLSTDDRFSQALQNVCLPSGLRTVILLAMPAAAKEAAAAPSSLSAAFVPSTSFAVPATIAVASAIDVPHFSLKSLSQKKATVV